MTREELEVKRWQINRDPALIGYDTAYRNLNRVVREYTKQPDPRAATYPLPNHEDISHRTTSELEAFMVATQKELDKRVRVNGYVAARGRGADDA